MASTGEPYGLFWNSDGGDRTYDSNSFEYWLKKFFTSGVFNGDLQVRASSGMTLVVGSGYANVDGKVKFWNAEFNLTLSPANSTYPRIDTVVITRDNVNRNITCEVVTGAYSGDTPQPTAPVRNAEIYQLILAQIYVGNGVTEITQANITDTRPDTSLCGYITGTVEELDFSAFTAQFEAYFAEFKATKMADFSAWELAQEAAYAAWFGLVQQQQIQDKADWDAWYAALQEELHELPEDTAEYLQIEIDEIRESGMSGSILHITTTESTLESKTVTVTGDYENEERTATFDSNLECTIMGIKSVGDITIESSDGIDTATKVIQVPYYGNYDVEIAFWAATVNIQGDENLYGATVTVKDSNNTTVGTVTLNAVTGQGTFIAKAPDTYTFSATYSGKTYTEELVVTQQTTYSVSISTIPDGSTVTPTDDIQTWLHCADIWDKDYATITQVLADASTLQALIASNNAVDYMARSTTWASDVCADNTAMTYIGSNDYCADTLLNDSTWINAICNSTYFESVLNVKIPTMTGYTTPSGTVLYSSAYSGSFQGYYAFDGNINTKWLPSVSATNNYIGYKFTENVKACMASIFYNTNRSVATNNNKMQAYIDSEWETVIDNIALFNESGTHDAGNQVFYPPITSDQFRLFIPDVMHDNTYQRGIMILQLYGRASS